MHFPLSLHPIPMHFPLSLHLIPMHFPLSLHLIPQTKHLTLCSLHRTLCSLHLTLCSLYSHICEQCVVSCGQSCRAQQRSISSLWKCGEEVGNHVCRIHLCIQRMVECEESVCVWYSGSLGVSVQHDADVFNGQLRLQYGVQREESVCI